MSLFQVLYVYDNEGNLGEYRRVSSNGDQAVYKSTSEITVPTNPINRLTVRNSLSGKPSDPGGVKKRQNLLMEVGIVGPDTKVHAGSVSLTIMVPSSGVIDTDLIRDMLARVINLAIDYPNAADSTPGAGGTSPISVNPEWAIIAQLQEL
jgi:hypothetical protein